MPKTITISEDTAMALYALAYYGSTAFKVAIEDLSELPKITPEEIGLMKAELEKAEAELKTFEAACMETFGEDEVLSKPLW